MLTASGRAYGASGPKVVQQKQNLLYDLYSITCLGYLRAEILIPALHQFWFITFFDCVLLSQHHKTTNLVYVEY